MTFKLQKFLVALLVAGSMLVSLGAQETIKFSKKSVAKGAVITVARTTSNDMNQTTVLPSQNQTVVSTAKMRDVKIFTVLEVSDKGVTKAKVAFKTFESTNKITMNGQERDMNNESPLTGKSYVLTIAESGLVAKTPEGEDVSADEVAAIKADLKTQIESGRLIDPHQRMDTVIGPREVAIGEKITIDKDIANKIFGAGSSGNNIESIELVLKGKKTVFGVSCALFDVTLNLDMSQAKAQGLDIKSKITGEYTVGIDTLWSFSAQVSGPITGGGKVPTPMGEAVVSLEGKVSMSAISAFQTAKK